MPVLYTCRNVDTVARLHLYGILTPFLIVATPRHTDKDLPAALRSVMNMPVVAATRFKSHIENT